MEVITPWLSIMIATLLVIWVHRLSKRVSYAKEKEFEALIFCVQHYLGLHYEESSFEIRVRKLIKEVENTKFAFILKEIGRSMFYASLKNSSILTSNNLESLKR